MDRRGAAGAVTTYITNGGGGLAEGIAVGPNMVFHSNTIGFLSIAVTTAKMAVTFWGARWKRATHRRLSPTMCY